MTILIADIGGTNARFGIVDNKGIHDLVYLECKNFAGPVEAAEHYLKEISSKTRPEVAVFAVAGPVNGDLINFTGSPWTFRISSSQKDMNLNHFEVMNDFKANALAVPDIAPELLHKIGGGEPVDEAPKASLAREQVWGWPISHGWEYGTKLTRQKEGMSPCRPLQNAKSIFSIA